MFLVQVSLFQGLYLDYSLFKIFFHLLQKKQSLFIDGSKNT